MVLVFPVGFVVSQLVLVVLFFLVFLPIGFLLRFRGWDPMLYRVRKSGDTFWEVKSISQDVRRYLRQY